MVQTEEIFDKNGNTKYKLITKTQTDKLTGETTKSEVGYYANGNTIIDNPGLYFDKQHLKTQGLNSQIEDSNQGKIGDCWLLSGINSFSFSEIGHEIISNAISESKNGYTVVLKGLGKNIEINASELQDAIESGEYSSGDPDMILFEMAFEKANYPHADTDEFSNDFPDDKHGTISGGRFANFTEGILGTNPRIASKDKYCDENGNEKTAVYEKHINKILNKFEKSDSMAAVVSFRTTSDEERICITDINGEEKVATDEGGAHAWSLKSVDKDNVTVVNPWNSSEEIVISRSELINKASTIEYIDLADVA